MPANDNRTRAQTQEGSFTAPSTGSFGHRVRRTAGYLLVASLAIAVALGVGTTAMATAAFDSETSTPQEELALVGSSDASADPPIEAQGVTGAPEGGTSWSRSELGDRTREPALASGDELDGTAAAQDVGSTGVSVTADVDADPDEHIRVEAHASVSDPVPIGDDSTVFGGAATYQCGSNSIVMGVACGALETTGPVGAHAELDADFGSDGP